MDGQVLFEGNIRYHISGMRIAIFLLMALLAGVVMLLTGIAGAPERISGLETGHDRSLTITADGQRYTIREIDNAEEFANAARSPH